MKFVFLLLLCINEFFIIKFTYALKSANKKRDNTCCADVVSRIASQLAAKAAQEVRSGYGSKSPKTSLMKQELAEKSMEAARMAQSNLASKIKLVKKLTQEKLALDFILKKLYDSKKQLEEAINKEIEALAVAKTLKELLDKALLIASEVAVSSDMVLTGVKNSIKTVNVMINLQDKEYHILCHKEHRARMDLQATKAAERKAVHSATKAKENVLELVT